MRIVVHLVCTECKRRNYSTTKNRQKRGVKLQLRKYCPHCRRHTVHKESKA